MEKQLTRENVQSIQWEQIIQCASGRQIIFWGCNEIGKLMLDALHTFNQEVLFVDDGFPSTSFAGEKVSRSNVLNTNADQYYVVVCATYYKDIELKLWQYGYMEYRDYAYLRKAEEGIIGAGTYRDFLDNFIVGQWRKTNLIMLGAKSRVEKGYEVKISKHTQIVLKTNAKLILHDLVKLSVEQIIVDNNATLEIFENSVIEKGKIYVGEDCHMMVGANSKLTGEMDIGLYERSSLTIGERFCHQNGGKYLVFRDSSIDLGSDACIYGYVYFQAIRGSQLIIGKRLNLMQNSEILSHFNSKLILGDDTRLHDGIFISSTQNSELIAGDFLRCNKDITMICGESHPVFDLRKPEKAGKPGHITLGKHIWLGRGVTILSNCEIGEGSMVGLQSRVTGTFPNNCMLFGDPASIIRKDFAWDYAETDDQLIEDKSFWNYTQFKDEPSIDKPQSPLKRNYSKEELAEMIEEMLPSDSDEWDSLTRIDLVLQLEEKLSMKFSEREKAEFEDVSHVVEVLMKRLS